MSQWFVWRTETAFGVVGICIMFAVGCRSSSTSKAERSSRSMADDANPTPSSSTAKSGEVAPSGVEDIANVAHEAQKQVEAFFGESFPRTYDVKVFPTRSAFTEYARQRWGMEQTECWMVAMGVASTIVVLSPEVWRTEACEHESTDKHIREIVTHELVHVFHGQHNPNPEFDGMDEAGWFVEGLAIHMAGQLDENRKQRLRRAVGDGRIPVRLADAWSGPDRYGICGSLVAHIDQRWGRAKLRELLAAANNAQILTSLQLSENALLDSWRESVAGN